MKLQLYMLAILAFGMSLFLLINFIFIWQFGRVSIIQSDPLVLVADTVIVLVALAFSLYCMVRQLIRISSPRK